MCLACRKTTLSIAAESGGVCALFTRLFIFLVRGYQYFISPLFPPTCRYTPTCSQYAVEAVTRYGPFRGIGLALWRLLRCHPFSRGGYDPLK
ncbi:MAG: membrane protein insertion efficiency factor YidD [Desulfobulbaceae bacterium]|nr:membrane protein insertion efficiency factor YidD [Desulfobulbaceae bacterium]